MGVYTYLAQSDALTLRSIFEQMDVVGNREALLASLSKMPTVVGGVLVVVGAMCVINGFKWHKWIVGVLALLLGLGLGHVLSQDMGKSNVVAIALGMLFAVVAIPMLKFSVAIFGGLAGAFLGANIWTISHASPADAQWAGACMGFIVLGMLSFIVFRIVVVAFTSIGGAAMMVFGGIALLLQVPEWQNSVREHLANNKFLLPLLLTTAAAGGVILQQARMQGSAQPAAAGAGKK